MLILSEGMLAASKNIFLQNANNHVTRQRRMLVADNGVFISSKEVFLPCRRGCSCQARECLAVARQSFRQTRASSCHTMAKACVKQGHVGPKQGRLFNSLGHSYARTRGPDTRECLCYMKECLLQTRVSSFQTQAIILLVNI